MPYWAYLWPGAFLLAGAIGRLGLPEGTPALEIGCGLGLSGLVGLADGLRVHFTDHDLTALRYVERSAAANGFDPSRYSTARLDWREPPADRYPVILGADVTYERRLIPLVAGLLAAMLAPGGLALVTDPHRVATGGFGDALEAAGLAFEVEEVEAEGELGRVRGTVPPDPPSPVVVRSSGRPSAASRAACGLRPATRGA